MIKNKKEKRNSIKPVKIREKKSVILRALIKKFSKRMKKS